MSGFLYLIGTLALIGGVFVLVGSKSAVHEILAGVSITVGVLGLGFGAVVEQLKRTADAMQEFHADARERVFVPMAAKSIKPSPFEWRGKSLMMMEDGQVAELNNKGVEKSRSPSLVEYDKRLK